MGHSCNLSYSSKKKKKKKKIFHEKRKLCFVNGIFDSNSTGLHLLFNRIELVASTDGDYQFNVQCEVSHMISPLQVCVTCEVLPMSVHVTLISDQGEVIDLYPNQKNVFNIGKVSLLT